MSEKKAPDNKREKEKERLIHVTEEQLQAGKAEIMKIVAGLNGAEKLADLLDKGRKKGNLSSNPTRWIRSTTCWKTWASTPPGRTTCRN